MLLKGLEEINDKPVILPKLIAWMEEIDQDYPDAPPMADRDRREIRRILARLTGKKDAVTDPDALQAAYWRRILSP